MKSILDRFRFRGRGETRVSDFPDMMYRDLPHIRNSSFSLDFFRRIWESGPGQNICVSPFSVESVLALLYGGAHGETRRAIGQAMGVGEVATTELDQDFKGLLDFWRKYPRSGDLQLDIANSVWTDTRYPIGGEFAKRATEYYDAEAGALDFDGAPEKAVRIINDWVKEKTQTKIPSLLDNIPPDTSLVLANAVYFKGLWGENTRFDRGLTRDETFYLLDGSSKQVPMMRYPKKRELPYYRGNGFQAILLPYLDQALGMALFLPDEQRGLDALFRGLRSESWPQMFSEFETSPGEVILPRFKLECSVTLNSVLSAMGMGVAFGSGADFRHVSPEPVWIGEARHRALLEVNEEGSEAGAGTIAFLVRGINLTPPEEFKLVFDHPFFCVILNRLTNSILFAAAVVDPS